MLLRVVYSDKVKVKKFVVDVELLHTQAKKGCVC